MSNTSKHVTSKQAVVIWFFLVAATLCSGWLVDHQGLAGQWTVAAVMLVAAFKAWAIILYYMDVKFAPLKLRIAFEAWVLMASSVIVIFWIIQSGVMAS